MNDNRHPAPNVGPPRPGMFSRLFWLAVVGGLIAVLLFPASYRITRLALLVLGLAAWFGFIAMLWRQRTVRLSLLGATLVVAVFLALPSRRLPSAETLRADYVDRLKSFDGAPYYWGGESSWGIDCSGLARRGLIDAFFWRGVRTLDAGLVRRAIDLWWHDCSAKALGELHRGLTVRLFYTPSINVLNHSKLQAGDLAVTANGIHIMVYLGEHRWIEADPSVGRVITVTSPSGDNPWFDEPINIVRWSVLE